eukprot:m.186911 g.186911  ORF g.186911 m.186911 type:complete len:592 (-) comp15599_c0_seq6:2142-3917(-)
MESASPQRNDPVLDILPEARNAPWRNDARAVEYLGHLTSLDSKELARSAQELEIETENVLRQTQSLAFSNYKAFIHAAHCSTDIFKDFVNVEASAHSLSEKLPDFADVCKDFAVKAEKISKHRTKTSLTLKNHSQILELLEIPQLMDTCVRNEYYEEALQLRAHVTHLSKKYAHIEVIKGICFDVELYARQMLASLLQQLQVDLQLPACLRIIGFLRRLDVFTEMQLRVQFLQARNEWLRRVLDAIPNNDAYSYITKTVEASRVHLFDIITQYKAVFSHMDSTTSEASGALLSSWVVQRVKQFLSVLKVHLPRLTDRLNSILGQCMHFALSLGRVGLDFRVLLPPLFEKAAYELFAAQCKIAVANLEDRLSSIDLFKHAGAGDFGAEGSEAIVPLTLMGAPVLGHLTNDILIAFNELRECAPLNVSGQIGGCLRDSLKLVSSSLRQHYDAHVHAYDPREIQEYQKMCRLFVESLIPCMKKCLEAIYTPSMFQDKADKMEDNSPAKILDAKTISEPLFPICPELEEGFMVHRDVIPLAEDDTLVDADTEERKEEDTEGNTESNMKREEPDPVDTLAEKDEGVHTSGEAVVLD